MNRIQIRILAFVLLAFALAAFPAAAQDGAGASASQGKVNLNTASADELALLPRVGPAIAERIVEYREQEGELTSVEDLMLVRGIGEKTFALMEPYLTLEGETTLTEKVRVSRRTSSEESAG